MSSAIKTDEKGEIFFPDAFRTGIIEEDGNTLFLLEFGKTQSERIGEGQEIKPLATVAVGSDELKLLCEHIIQIGIRHKIDFWQEFTSSDIETEDGDENGET